MYFCNEGKSIKIHFGFMTETSNGSLGKVNNEGYFNSHLCLIPTYKDIEFKCNLFEKMIKAIDF